MKRRKRKIGFTLVELLVVIAIIALLMGILMPALARVRAIAFRMTCGTNLSGIGKAMLIYANDNDDELPRSGWGSATLLSKDLYDWLGGLTNGAENNRYGAYDDPPGRASLASNFYLLVKYADVTPKSFVCKSDSGTSEFMLTKVEDELPTGITITELELIDIWDFGEIFQSGSETDRGPDLYCSYAYQHPFSLYTLTTSSEPGMAVAADRNPWVRSPGGGPRPQGDWDTYGLAFVDPEAVDLNKAKKGNAVIHQEDGQNVLFIDCHVNFEKLPYCGVDEDNIYTPYQDADGDGLPDKEVDIRIGLQPNDDGETTRFPGGRKDSYLLGNEQGVVASR